MFNPDFEISRFQHTLRLRGVPDETIQQIIGEIQAEVSAIVGETIDTHMMQAVEVGESMGAHDFVDELIPKRVGSTFNITTESGKSDYSTPEVEMKSKLLRNTKISKDGTKYKRIPMKTRRDAPQAHDSMSDMRLAARQQQMEGYQQRQRTRMQAQLKGAFSDTTSYTNLKYTRDFVKVQRQRKKTIKNNSATTHFKTVTDKQSTDAWKIPPRDLNMNGFLIDLNTSLTRQIEQQVLALIKKYEGQV